MTELDLEEIGGGHIDIYVQCCSNYGSEIFMTVRDHDEPESGTAIMEPRHARELAAMLLQAADECDDENGSGIETSAVVQWHRIEDPATDMPSEEDATADGYLLITTKSGEVRVEELTVVHTENGWGVGFVYSDIDDVAAWARFPEPCKTDDK